MTICSTDQYFKLGARCRDCGWRGTVGELRSKGTDNAYANFRCPTCDQQNTEWPIGTHEEHETKQ